MLIVSLLAFAVMGGGAKPGSTYIPPHMEDGKLVPAETR
jgi:hypothetical protein